MPFYDLKCPKCCTEYNDVKHTIAKMSNGIKCEKCGELLEVIHHSPIYFQLKGDGWTGRGK